MLTASALLLSCGCSRSLNMGSFGSCYSSGFDYSPRHRDPLEAKLRDSLTNAENRWSSARLPNLLRLRWVRSSTAGFHS